MTTKPNLARAGKPNFTSLLDEAPTEIRRVPLLPEGTYYCTVVKGPDYGKTRKGDTSIEFTLQPYAADDDVDAAELEEAEGLEGKTIRVTFYEILSVIGRLDKFHKDCGLELDPMISSRGRNDLCFNCQVGVYLKHEIGQDGETPYAKVARTLPAEG